MYPGYEQYWRSILADPDGVLPLSGKVASSEEVAYARFADRTPHFVLSSRLDEVAWRTTTVLRDIEEIRRLKERSGKDIYAVGGAKFVSSLMNLNLVDELRLTVHPLVLGKGKALFEDVSERHSLKLVRANPSESGRLSLTYQAA